MTIYAFQCDNCGNEELDEYYTHIGEAHLRPSQCCGARLRRACSFSFRRSMPEHFNHTVGQYVSNDRQFKDQLKLKSEELSARTGMDHNFQPIDVTDMKACGATEEGLDTTFKKRHDAGMTDAQIL